MHLIKKVDRDQNVGYRLKTRRRPHYEIAGGTYFCTTNASYGKIFSEADRDQIMESIHFLAERDYTLVACVVMPDHIHMLIRPNMLGNSEAVTLERIFHSVKSFTAHNISKGPQGHVWQPERDDHLIRDEKEFYFYKQYLIENPVVAGLVEEPQQYQWLWFYDMMEGENDPKHNRKEGSSNDLGNPNSVGLIL